MHYPAREDFVFRVCFLRQNFVPIVLFGHVMRLVDKVRFESRSGAGCSNSDYDLYQTKCCHRFGVEDDELLQFYFDSADLARTAFLERGTPCPFCGAKDWRLELIEDPTLIPPEWKWAAPKELRCQLTEPEAGGNAG